MAVTFDEVLDKVGRAGEAIGVDGQASPVLVAVVREFQAKAEKARGAANVPSREHIVELEQAGDSAKAAAEADSGADAATREAIVAAHLAICMLKAGS
jgi:hypothetical protein